MKTITLTDEAYERLKDWKIGPRDSFSSVVLRLVPKRGTLADLLDGFRQLPPLTEQQAQIMTEEIGWANDWGDLEQHSPPWPEAAESPQDRGSP